MNHDVKLNNCLVQFLFEYAYWNGLQVCNSKNTQVKILWKFKDKISFEEN